MPALLPLFLIQSLWLYSTNHCFILLFYYFIIVSCLHLSLASWLLFSNKSSVQHNHHPVFLWYLVSHDLLPSLAHYHFIPGWHLGWPASMKLHVICDKRISSMLCNTMTTTTCWHDLNNRMESEDSSWVFGVGRQRHPSVSRDAQVLACGQVTKPQLLLPPNYITCASITSPVVSTVSQRQVPLRNSDWRNFMKTAPNVRPLHWTI